MEVGRVTGGRHSIIVAFMRWMLPKRAFPLTEALASLAID